MRDVSAARLLPLHCYTRKVSAAAALVDATGTIIRLDSPPRRIVSLVPSLTETLFALGLGERVVGITRYCVEPAAQVAALPKLGGTKDPDIAAIVRLQPELVIASSEENRADDVAALRRARISILVTLYETVGAAVDGIGTLAALLGVAHEPLWLREARAEVAAAGRRSQAPVPYFCPIWRRPYMVARDDTYMADLLRLAGGCNAVHGEGPAHYNAVELNALQSANPSVILLPDEPYPFAAKHLADFAPYAEIEAVAHGRIHFVDGKALTWYGPRTAGALRSFAGIFDAARSGAAASPRHE
jgi:ABC-type hemin transport system substrate-binding protein